jgi:hypothetical protein
MYNSESIILEKPIMVADLVKGKGMADEELFS